MDAPDPAGPRNFLVAARPAARSVARMLLTCQAGYEGLLARELSELQGATVAEQGPGWVRGAGVVDPARLAFPWCTLRDPIEIRGESVNVLASRLAEFFLGSLRGERIDASWPSVWSGPPELVGLGRRISAVEAAFGELLKKKLSRVAKLAVAEPPRGLGPARGCGCSSRISAASWSPGRRLCTGSDGWRMMIWRPPVPT
jgi:hypothetical protein